MAQGSRIRPVSLVKSGLWGVSLLALISCQGAPTQPRTPISQAEAITSIPGELLVRFQPDASAQTRADLRQRFHVTSTDPLLPDIERWRFTGDASAVQKALTGLPAIRYAEPNYRRHVTAYTPIERSDPAINQWYLGASRGINVDAAWATASFVAATNSAAPGSGVTVAIVDTGIDTCHPDLAAHIATTSTGAIRFIDEVGADTAFETGSTDFTGRDGNGHGTHCAGLVGAIGYNVGTTGCNGSAVSGRAGIVGVAPGVSILPVKSMRADGSGDDAAIAKGLIDATNAGADVINLSVGGAAPSQTLADAIAYDLASGSTVVIAAGNGSGSPVYFPAAYAGVVAVGAVTGASAAPNTVAWYANRGPEVTVVAPGGDLSNGQETDPNVGIYSTLPTYDCWVDHHGQTRAYGIQVGTSMATPIVSGVAALVIADAKAHGQRMTPSQVRERLIATATPLGTGTFSNDWGYGLVNPAKALAWTTPGGSLQ